MKVWKTQEYFVYFKFFELHSWGKRSADNRRRIESAVTLTQYAEKIAQRL